MNLKCNILVSTFAFKCKLYRYASGDDEWDIHRTEEEDDSAARGAAVFIEKPPSSTDEVMGEGQGEVGPSSKPSGPAMPHTISLPSLPLLLTLAPDADGGYTPGDAMGKQSGAGAEETAARDAAEWQPAGTSLFIGMTAVGLSTR